MSQHLICKLAELFDGQRRMVDIDGTEVMVLEHEGKVYAIRNRCPHSGGPVGEGVILGRVEAELGADLDITCERFSDEIFEIVCPWHGWAYELDSGEFAGDAHVVLTTYETVVKEGVVYVSM